MDIRTFTFNPFSTNCFVVHDGGEAVIVDPACQAPGEVRAVLDYVSDHELNVRHLLLTHAHIDHIFGCQAIADAFDLEIRLHPADGPLLKNAPQQAEMFGVSLEEISAPVVPLSEEDTVAFGEASWQVLHTPGHSPGSVSFVDHENRFVLSGDVLFQGSIGRTDLWEGSLPVLMRSIFQKLVPLGDDVSVYPGHGPVTTVGSEVKHNPFLTGSMPQMT
jgi:glyoxylase-like metal-dependent hydrolase (beta-lactamase superfamily II)